MIVSSPAPEKNSAQDVFILLVAAAGSTVAVGWLYHLVARFFDLVIVSPILAGVLVGIPIAFAGVHVRWRRSLSLLTLGALCGLTAMGLRYYFDSQDFYNELLPKALAKQQGISEEAARNNIAWANQALPWWGPYARYFQMMGDVGLEISDTHTSSYSQPTPVAGTPLYILLGASVFLATVAAAAVSNGGCSRTGPSADPLSRPAGT